ncbi:hypothetical protein EDD11_009986 [Mortierella claussenii]|nr:hypothetical protein EDD11_009986 [Mortierella claussenii]
MAVVSSIVPSNNVRIRPHRANAHAHADDERTGDVSASSNNSRSSTNNATSVSNSSSFGLSSKQCSPEVLSSSAEQGSSSRLDHSDAASVSIKSYIEPTAPTTPTSSKSRTEPLYDIDMEDSEASRRSFPSQHLSASASASSSLRVKLKNRVHTTLTSIKSSSNLKEKAQLQAAASSYSTASTLTPRPVSADLQPQQQTQSPPSALIVSDSQQNSAMLRLSKPFWTFPRVRPEPTSSKLLPWGDGNGRPGSLVDNIPRTTAHVDLDSIMITSDLEPAARLHVEKLNSDDDNDDDQSIDIIMPSDYDDYTLFAELPLKKRKKLQAAVAAMASGMSQESKGKRPHAMKRLLLPQKATIPKDKGGKVDGSDDNIITTSDNTFPQRGSKKRPKDQDSIEQKQQQEPKKMIKSNSEGRSEWRRAIMKSLHIGRGNQMGKKATGSSTIIESPMESAPNREDMVAPRNLALRDSGVYSGDQVARTQRSESVSSIRSRSMATSSHAGLMATTLPKPTNPGSRRETLEMAMRRRRSSAARSIFYDHDSHPSLPRNLHLMDDDATSTHVTHTFTSFTLELADIHHAHAVVNNSVVPGLFNFKRQPRLTMSSMNNMDTDHEFKGFDSDGDAMSGYTGDADISMEEIFIRPKTPMGRLRESGSRDSMSRRNSSLGDADSDTFFELPLLSNRSRTLVKSIGGSRIGGSVPKSLESNHRESPRSSRNSTPTLHRKTGRLLKSLSGTNDNPSPSDNMVPSLSFRTSASQHAMDEVVTWKSKNSLQPSGSSAPTLHLKAPPTARGGGLLSSRNSSIPTSTILTQTSYPSQINTASNGPMEVLRHHRQQSSAHSIHNSHQHQTSADTLLPHHLKNFSAASTLSTSSLYSAQTLQGHGGPLSFQPKEFDANQECSPSTPADLKAMDFEALLKTAEREQQKGREERTLKKKKSFQIQTSRSLRIHQNAENYSSGLYKSYTSLSSKSALSALAASSPNLDEMRGRGSDASYHSSNGSPQHSPPNSLQHGRSHSSNGIRYGDPQGQNSRIEQSASSQGHPRMPISRSVIAFELAESAGGRNASRSKRVMKKKTSVIKLSGNVQGRREDDGMIRVSVTPTPHHRR